jgi:Uri superfamily endonuclease
MKGSYILVIDLVEAARLKVGRLGTFEFPAGLYLYCGSALNGLEDRIRRHLRRDKKGHWHIDYLTTVAPVVEVWWISDENRWECRWAQSIRERGGQIVAPGFGSSDCRCPTHLLKWEERGEMDGLRQALFREASQEKVGRWVAGKDEDSPGFALGGLTDS